VKRHFPAVCGWLVFSVCACILTATAAAQDEAIQLVVDLLGEQDRELRQLAFEQIRDELKGEAATLKFADLLPKYPPPTQVGLLGALADRGDAAAAPAVRDLAASSKDDEVRVAAIAALGKLGGPADLKMLIGRVSAGSAAERAAARASLVRLPGDAVSTAIAAELIAVPAPARVTLFEVLTERRARNTIPTMLDAAAAADPAVRRAAMAALGELAGPDDLAGMVQGVLKAEVGREREDAEKAVMFVCRRIAESEDRAAPLLAAMNALPDPERMILLSALGRVGGSSAVPEVEKAIRDSRPDWHEAGLRALCNWPDASVTSRLLYSARTDEHPDHRTMALRALIRIAPLDDDRTDRRRLDVLRTAWVMCQTDAERNLVFDRARSIRAVETLRFVAPFIDVPQFAEKACETVVELAHHSSLRESNKEEFHRALDKVLRTSNDATVKDRAQRYKTGQTWVRPKAAS
jgi:HEAT repeat protein